MPTHTQTSTQKEAKMGLIRVSVTLINARDEVAVRWASLRPTRCAATPPRP